MDAPAKCAVKHCYAILKHKVGVLTFELEGEHPDLCHGCLSRGVSLFLFTRGRRNKHCVTNDNWVLGGVFLDVGVREHPTGG